MLKLIEAMKQLVFVIEADIKLRHKKSKSKDERLFELLGRVKDILEETEEDIHRTRIEILEKGGNLPPEGV